MDCTDNPALPIRNWKELLGKVKENPIGNSLAEPTSRSLGNDCTSKKIFSSPQVSPSMKIKIKFPHP